MPPSPIEATATRPKPHRLAGLDLARGFAVIGMVFVNFMYVLSYTHVDDLVQDGSAWTAHSPVGMAAAVVVLVGLAGRSAAVFLVLFGIGMAIQHRRGGSPSPLRRYLLLLGGGLVFIPLWEADILHFIGLFGLLSLPLLRLRTAWLWVLCIALLVGAELLRLQFDYTTGWQPGSVGSHYEDMWSLAGQLRQLFFNGYHPVFPWLSFVLFGLVLGRLDLRDEGTLRRMTVAGIVTAVLGFGTQALGVSAEFFPAESLFVLLGLANATWIVGACLLVGCGEQPSRYRRAIEDMGRLALSQYLGHVFLGIVPIMIVRRENTDLSFENAFALAVVYLVTTGIAGTIWLRHHAQGPLERALRVASGSG